MKLLLLSYGTLLCTSVFGQNYAAVTVQDWLNEVHLECPQNASPENVSAYVNLVGNCKVVYATDAVKGQKTSVLSAYLLMDKCNPDLQRDQGANVRPDTFNPLKYFLNFHAKSDQYIEIDHSNYYFFIPANN